MIDYSVFSQPAAARGSIISGPVSRSATAFISAFSAKFGLRVIWLSAVRVGGLFPVATPAFDFSFGGGRAGLAVEDTPRARNASFDTGMPDGRYFVARSRPSRSFFV
jgi:hypothetical protein